MSCRSPNTLRTLFSCPTPIAPLALSARAAISISILLRRGDHKASSTDPGNGDPVTRICFPMSAALGLGTSTPEACPFAFGLRTADFGLSLYEQLGDGVGVEQLTRHPVWVNLNAVRWFRRAPSNPFHDSSPRLSGVANQDGMLDGSFFGQTDRASTC